jgi:hypothetical protein
MGIGAVIAVVGKLEGNKLFPNLLSFLGIISIFYTVWAKNFEDNSWFQGL